MNILAQILFTWIFAALSAGTPPAQFDVNGHFVGNQTPATVMAHTRIK